MKKVVWSVKAQKNYRDNLLYLKEFWTKREIKKFMKSVDTAIMNISRNPFIGSVYEENIHYRKYLIAEQIYLYYRLTEKDEILLASFWNNYQNPEKLKKLLP